MHEMSTCQQLIKQIESVSAENGNRPVIKVHLTVGELARVDVGELAELFPLASKNTLAQQAELVIAHEPISVHCPKCQLKSDVTADRMCCPRCSYDTPELVAGTEMLLTSIEFA